MKKRKAAVAAPISTYKDSHNSERIQADTQKARKAIVLEMLKGGMQTTAMGLNVMIGGNDARRWMTEVRRKADGYTVRTYPYAPPNPHHRNQVRAVAGYFRR